MPILFLVSFGLWVFCFRGFLSGHLAITSDAVSYYDHIQFFIKSLLQGVFPLWDPYWSAGVPNDFFLRRIGAYNPFFFLIIVFHKAGLAYYTAYLWYLVVYFFVGMAGFYCLAKRLFRGDSLAAFIAYLILAFSALGTRTFDSYIILVTVPLIWFFYFLVSFGGRPRVWSFLGLTFTVMILLTTYIPFYFIVIALVFVLVFPLLYARETVECFRRSLGFARAHPVILVCCLFAIIAALLPGLSFWAEAGKNSIALPDRHSTSTAANVLAVPQAVVNSWALMEEFFFSAYFSDLRRIQFAVVFVPILSFVLLGLGLLLRVTRLTVFLLLFGTVFVVIATPWGASVHDFLFYHVFFFKYFRNLHFFLWFLLLPLFALLAAEQCRGFLATAEGFSRRKPLAVYVLLIHLVALSLLWVQGNAVLSSYLVVVLSGATFLALATSRLSVRSGFLPAILLVLVVAQPLEVFHYFSQNVSKKNNDFNYDSIAWQFPLVRSLKEMVERVSDRYYSTLDYMVLQKEMDGASLSEYERHRFVLYDVVQRESDDDVPVLRSIVGQGKNTALVPADYPLAVETRGLVRSSRAQAVSSEKDGIRVVAHNANTTVLETDLSSPKFLVYNDAWHAQWRVKVNGRNERLWRANRAFRGVWLPAGKSEVVFYYAGPLPYLLNLMLLGIFYGMFIALLFISWRERVIFVRRIVK